MNELFLCRGGRAFQQQRAHFLVVDPADWHWRTCCDGQQIDRPADAVQAMFGLNGLHGVAALFARGDRSALEWIEATHRLGSRLPGLMRPLDYLLLLGEVPVRFRREERGVVWCDGYELQDSGWERVFMPPLEWPKVDLEARLTRLKEPPSPPGW